MKIIPEFRCLLTVLALLAGEHLTLAQPILNIAPAGSQSILFWPATPTNYVLQSTTNLTATNWVTEAEAIPVTAVTISNISPVKFFRLVSPEPPGGMVLIPAGSFLIGNSIGDNDVTDAIPTNVYLSAFYMDMNVVSLSKWQSVYSYAAGAGYSFVNAGSGKATNHPVQTVNWFDCVKWCNARSQQDGLTPVYYTDAGLTQIYTNDDNGTTIHPNWAANGYRLPTEAEWEKAARGGLHGRRFPWGNLISGYQANYVSTNLSYDLGPVGTNAIGLIDGYPYTSPIGSFDVNGYGLYDMAGNVFEWCWDWYAAPPYPSGSAYLGGIDPRGAATGNRRIERGGSWGFGEAAAARCFRRNFFNQANAADSIGFRCVRGL